LFKTNLAQTKTKEIKRSPATINRALFLLAERLQPHSLGRPFQSCRRATGVATDRLVHEPEGVIIAARLQVKGGSFRDLPLTRELSDSLGGWFAFRVLAIVSKKGIEFLLRAR